MIILLDTNALIWWLKDDPKLGSRARSILADGRHELITSVISLWELSIKWRIGKLEYKGSVFADLLSEQNIRLLMIKPQHFEVLESLTSHHKDPFDHMIIAQAKAEGARLMTSDPHLRDYGVECISTS